MEASRCRQGRSVNEPDGINHHVCKMGLASPGPEPLAGRWPRLAAALLFVVALATALAAGLTRQPTSAMVSRQAPQRAGHQQAAASPTPEGSWWENGRQAIAGVSDLAAGAIAAGQAPAPEPLTILLLGVDARPGEAIDVGVRADAILLLRLDPVSGACRLLAVPRDTRTELPGYGVSKINHALAVGGIPYQIEVIESFLGITIDRYALADFRAFADVIDALGGVPLTVTEPFSQGEVTFESGAHWLTGDEALAYVRYRGDAGGDFGRIARTRQMVRAIAERAASTELVSAAPGIMSAIAEHIRTDLSLVEITSLIAYYQPTCGAGQIDLASLSGEVASFPDPIVGETLSYVVVGDAEKAAKVAGLLGASP